MKIQTRHQMAEELENLGVTGAAAEAILKETATLRHQARVAQAKEAAIQAAETLLGRSRGDNLEEDWQVRDHAALVCLFDAAGTGGTANVSGDSTSRLGCFSSLGKGRKQARDGAAWTAAIAAAGEELATGRKNLSYVPIILNGKGEVYPVLSDPEKPEDGPGIGIATADNSETLTISELKEANFLHVALTVAREGLRRSLGLKAWRRDLPVRTKNDADNTPIVERWATVVNAISGELSELARKDAYVRGQVDGRQGADYLDRICKEAPEHQSAYMEGFRAGQAETNTEDAPAE